MDAFRLSRLATDVLRADECPRFIFLPARRLIGRLLLFLAVDTVLLTMTFSLLAIVAIPVLVFWSYLYLLFCHIWRRYRLSRFYTVATPVTALLLAVGVRCALYSL